MTPAIQTALHAKNHAVSLWKHNGRPNESSNFYLLEKKFKTVELCRQVHIEIARQRNEEKACVLHARQSDNALFHRLIKKQRGQCSKFIELQVGQETFPQDNIINGWYSHFKKLATKTENPNYDLKFLEQVEEEVAIIHSICLNSTQEIQSISDKEIQDMIASLNRWKAPDVYGVTAEHLIYGGQNTLDIVKVLMNCILFERNAPVSLKLGIFFFQPTIQKQRQP